MIIYLKGMCCIILLVYIDMRYFTQKLDSMFKKMLLCT